MQVGAAILPMIRVRPDARRRDNAETVPRRISYRVRKLPIDVGIRRQRLVGYEPPNRGPRDGSLLLSIRAVYSIIELNNTGQTFWRASL
jgi:hypothetical protein